MIAAEQRIGELLLAIPTASGKRTDLETSSTRVEEVKTKTETVKQMGYSKDDASDYQQMAKHPEVVQKVKTKTSNTGRGARGPCLGASRRASAIYTQGKQPVRRDNRSARRTKPR